MSRESLIQRPEARRGKVFQSSRLFPDWYSERASETSSSSFPAFASDSICSSQTRASNSANHARNFLSSSALRCRIRSSSFSSSVITAPKIVRFGDFTPIDCVPANVRLQARAVRGASRCKPLLVRTRSNRAQPWKVRNRPIPDRRHPMISASNAVGERRFFFARSPSWAMSHSILGGPSDVLGFHKRMHGRESCSARAATRTCRKVASSAASAVPLCHVSVQAAATRSP